MVVDAVCADSYIVVLLVVVVFAALINAQTLKILHEVFVLIEMRGGGLNDSLLGTCSSKHVFDAIQHVIECLEDRASRFVNELTCFIPVDGSDVVACSTFTHSPCRQKDT